MGYDSVRNIRNFYIDADIDGRKTNLRGGPTASTDGLKATLYVRNEGAVLEAISIMCFERDGTLSVVVEDKVRQNGVNHSYSFTTQR